MSAPPPVRVYGGYLWVWAPRHPECIPGSKRALAHRMKWHDLRGPIPPGMVVHHRNGNRADNRIRNLRLMTNSEHIAWHREQERRDRRPRTASGVSR